MVGTEVSWMHWLIAEFTGSGLTPILEVYTARKNGHRKEAKDRDDFGSKDLKYTLHVFHEIDQQSRAVATSVLTPRTKGNYIIMHGVDVSTR